MQKYCFFLIYAREEDFSEKAPQETTKHRIISGGREEGIADWQSGQCEES
jgi:hypothetical protein